MAPELRMNLQFYDEKSDIFSFGVVLWTLLNCVQPTYNSKIYDMKSVDAIKWLMEGLEGVDNRYLELKSINNKLFIYLELVSFNLTGSSTSHIKFWFSSWI